MMDTVKRFVRDEEFRDDEPTREVYIPDPDLYFEDAEEQEFLDEPTKRFSVLRMKVVRLEDV